MQKLLSLLLIGCMITTGASAQYRYRGRMYMGSTQPRYRNSQPRQQVARPAFQPSFNISLGYGFPNLDKNDMLEFYNYYPAKATQTGPFLVSADYRFNRTTSIGVMVNYGKVNRQYYFNNDVSPTFTGKLENTAVMLNLMNYLAGNKTVSPYLRTAIGINIPHSSYINDKTGEVVARANDDNTLAYQASLGVKINFTPRAGFFAEAGYGKYIVAGGLTFSF
jgi:predicted porin